MKRKRSRGASSDQVGTEPIVNTDEAQRWLAALVDSSYDAIIGKRLDGIVTSWNAAARRIYGYTAEEMIGASIERVIPPDRVAEFTQIMARLQQGQRVDHFDTVRLHKDGARVDVSITISSVRNAAGQIIGASTITRDITEQKRLEAALRRREEELTDFIENATVGLHWIDADGRVAWANQTELDMLGYAREEYIGHHIAEFHADQETIKDILDRLANKETLREYEARLRCKDGRIRYVLINSNVLWEDGQFIHTRCFTRDITERKLAEEERAQLLESERIARVEAQEAVRMRDVFLSVASHELKTPLTSLLGNAQLLQRRARREGAFSSRNEHAISVIVEQARRLGKMIAALLDLSRIEMGQLSIEHEPVDVCALVRRVVAEVQPALDQHWVESAGTDARLLVEGDELRLEQVLQNLIQNAIKYSPDGRLVVVHVEQRGSQACVAVIDQGIGIPPQAIPRLFERLYRAGNVDERQISGMGIGLYVVREIIALHGGTVDVQSEEGRGSTFAFSLPLLDRATATLRD